MWRRSPYDDLFDVFRDFDSLFRRTLSEFAPANAPGRLLASGEPVADARPTGGLLLPGPGGYLPVAESYVADGRIFLRIELPGVEPSDVNVTMTGDRLVVSGEKKASREVKETDRCVREITHGRFERTFTLPENLKSEQIQARFENGVLELSMPVPTAEEPKKIKVDIAPGPTKPAKAA